MITRIHERYDINDINEPVIPLPFHSEPVTVNVYNTCNDMTQVLHASVLPFQFCSLHLPALVVTHIYEATSDDTPTTLLPACDASRSLLPRR